MSNLTQGSIYDVNDFISRKGDFIGFTFNGIHSSELGITRVSEGDRYVKSLLPSYSNKTLAIPGSDGTYYFGTTYNQRAIKISVAYDHLTQSQFGRLSQIFGQKKIVPLIFDEEPYKVYNVKISGEPNFTYICFEEEGQRIYKGEGSIQLICYSPFAYSRYKYEEEYTIENIPEWYSNDEERPDLFVNIDEWIESSGIKPKGEYDTYNVTTGKILLWNGGQLETDFNLYIPFVSNIIPAFNISLDDNESQLFLKEITKKGNDAKIKINTKNNLIEGVDMNNKITGTIYNQYIEKGHFFKIPIGENVLSTSAGITEEVIEYRYLYY